MERRTLLAAVTAALGLAFLAGLLAGREHASSGSNPASSRPRAVTGSVPAAGSSIGPVQTPGSPPPDPHDLDLAGLVPRGGAVDGVWFVSGGVAVAWHRGSGRAARWDLRLWAPDRVRGGWLDWKPWRLIRRSPYPIADWIGRSGVRITDVTHDGQPDLLVSVGIVGSNHGATLISVFSGAPPHRRIYGFGSEVDQLGRRAYGRNISETEWGARNGLLWFQEPRGGQSVCCPDFLLRYKLRWNGHGWDRVSEQRIPQHYG